MDRPLRVNVTLGRFGWLLVAALIVLWIARPVLAPFIVAAVAAYAFSPLVARAERRTHWRRLVIVLIGYVVLAAIVAVGIVALAGPVGAEIQALTANGPAELARAIRGLLGRDAIEIGGQTITAADIAAQIQERLSGLVSSPGDAIHLAAEIGDILLESLLALIVAFYFLVDGAKLRDNAVALLPDEFRDRTALLLDRIHEVLARWLRGQLLLIVLVAAIVYLILGPILHVPYALALAILTGVLEVIPLVGPLIATAIAAVDAFAAGGAGLAVTVIVVYAVLRQVEDQVVAPIVIGRAVHLHPVTTIFAVLVGLSVYGLLGGLLGVPFAAALNVVVREIYADRSVHEGAMVPPLPATLPPPPDPETAAT